MMDGGNGYRESRPDREQEAMEVLSLLSIGLCSRTLTTSTRMEERFGGLKAPKGKQLSVCTAGCGEE